MGIIKAAINSLGGSLADQWLEVIEPPTTMTETVVFAPGVKVRGNSNRNSNVKGSDNLVSNGSLIHIWPGMMMILVDGGRIIAASCEEGYFEVRDTTAPSLFAGQFGDAFKDTFNRFKFGGVTPREQRVYYINMQEIRGIKYGTENTMNYFDAMYQTELFIRAHGMYSIKIKDPMKFFVEVVPKGDALAGKTIDFKYIKEQFNGGFLTALRDSLGGLSVDGYPIYTIHKQTRNLTKYLADALDEEWTVLRGIEIVDVTISITYDEDSEKMIKSRSEAMMFGDARVQSGYMAKNVAEGIKAAGNNSNGAMNGFIGMGMGMNMGANVMQGYQQQGYQQQPAYNTPQPQGGYQPPQQQGYQQQQPQQQPQGDSWRCSCGAVNTGKFCNQCGNKKPEPVQQNTAGSWVCKCGTTNTGKFCQECGSPMPSAPTKCSKCGYELPKGATSKFCPECGNKL